MRCLATYIVSKLVILLESRIFFKEPKTNREPLWPEAGDKLVLIKQYKVYNSSLTVL